MRSLLLLLTFAATLGLTVISPYVGLLSWAWFSFMQPHRETFGFAAGFSFDWYAAVVTIAAWMISNEKKTVQIGPTGVLLLLFALWICVTTYFAIDPGFSYGLWERTEKSLILAFFVVLMTTSMVRAQAIVWIIALSLGYYAAKGLGWIFGGGGHVFGPAQSMIGDNNLLGVALVTTIPLLVYLARTSANRLVALGCVAATVVTIVAVIGTFSRGAFVGLVVMGALMVARSRAKLWGIGFGIVAVALVSVLAPASWYDRMGSILEDPDQSVLSRFQAWHTAWNVATQRPWIGGGFNFGEQQSVWDRYSDLPVGTRFRAAHNMYFEVLGEHGWIGLGLYVLIMLSAVRNTMVAARLARNRPEARAMVDLSNALQLSILCLAVAGSTLSLAYYDVYLTMYAMTFALRRMIRAATMSVPEPALTIFRPPVTAARAGPPIVD